MLFPANLREQRKVLPDSWIIRHVRQARQRTDLRLFLFDLHAGVWQVGCR